MNAWLLQQYEGLSGLAMGAAPQPAPATGEVLLRLHLAALNPADRYLTERLYPAHPPLPHILGREGLGTIVAVGPDVDVKLSGQRRIILRGEAGVTRPGTLAEFVAVPADVLAPIPAGWGDEQAASAAISYLTAYQALTQWGDLPPSRMLISGASGGVGTAAVQLAGAMGHRVIALSRSEDKRRRLLDMGAAMALDPVDEQWRKTVKDAVGGIDLAIDNVGGHLFNQIVQAMAFNGRISVVGRLAGPVPQFNTASLLFRRLRIGGVAINTYTPAESDTAWARVLQLLDRAQTRPVVDSVFAFAELPAAFERLATGPMGKVLVHVSK